MINKVEYSIYRIPFKTKMENSNYIYKFQDYIFIKVSKDNNEQILEVSPLAKFSTEKIKNIKKIFEDTEYVYKNDLPSLEYAISQINQKYSKIPYLKTAILIGGKDNLEKKINYYIKYGFKSFKIKFSKDSFESKYKEIEKFINKYKIRADFNNEFSIKEAQDFLDQNKHIKFDFIEGLLKSKNIKNYLKINRYKQKLSIDLTLNNLDDILEIIKFDCIDYVAIKPKLLGNYNKSIKLIDLLYKSNIKSYISSSFETQVGIYKTLSLAKYMNEVYKEKIIHGLSTSKYLIDEINNGILLDKGKIYFKYEKLNFYKLSKFQITSWKDIKNKTLLQNINDEF
jgi:O-succinylbenzoate synthase